MHWEHCKFYSKSKHKEKSIKFVITPHKVKRGNVRLFKKIAVFSFFFTKSNMYCIK